jgi:hypothetical protein
MTNDPYTEIAEHLNVSRHSREEKEVGRGVRPECDQLATRVKELETVLSLDPERLRLDKRVRIETKRALADILESLSDD